MAPLLYPCSGTEPRAAEKLVDLVKDLLTADGIGEVLVPCESKDWTHDVRVRDGIPLPDGTARNLVGAMEKLDISVSE